MNSPKEKRFPFRKGLISKQKSANKVCMIQVMGGFRFAWVTKPYNENKEDF